VIVAAFLLLAGLGLGVLSAAAELIGDAVSRLTGRGRR
jgi:hypothetical protein